MVIWLPYKEAMGRLGCFSLEKRCQGGEGDLHIAHVVVCVDL